MPGWKRRVARRLPAHLLTRHWNHLPMGAPSRLSKMADPRPVTSANLEAQEPTTPEEPPLQLLLRRGGASETGDESTPYG
ncbi:hypothetical protein E2C01_088980 [Portunus trituberculatus]|uniref:Uncharacterized protein n=1 Tax=Portunus trituberculatus TaxID=210409 RepID=A0A5B7JHW4_PORTR|nr:hypothetical protein [Portunus trituberculatus]